VSATDDSKEPPFRECWAMSLGEGFRVFELSKDRSRDWRFMSLRDVLHDELRMSGLHPVTMVNVLSYLRFRFLSRRDDLMGMMRRRFVYELGVGLIEAIGYQLPRAESDKPVLIPQSTWKLGNLDWERAEVSGAGFTFADIRILMPRPSALIKEGSWQLDPVPELRAFEPSEERRLHLGLMARSIITPKERVGRPSHKDAIERAYEELKPHDGLTDKELFHRIREHVQRSKGLTDVKGLGDSAIQKHVIRLRREDGPQKN